MSKLEQMDHLRQVLEELKDKAMNLRTDLAELMRMIEADEFIPEADNQSIARQLLQIHAMQKKFADSFAGLDQGAFPATIAEALGRLEQCRQEETYRRRYREAMHFFLSLRSEDDLTQRLLDERKTRLSALDLMSMDEAACKHAADGYVWLFDAYRETDQVKKFSLIYKLASEFEEPIVMGIQFGTLKVEEDEEVAALSEEPEIQTAEVRDQSTPKSVPLSEEEQEGAELSPSAGHDAKAAELLPSEEHAEAGNQEPEAQDIWQQLGIEEPKALLHPEDASLLETESADKAEAKFSVKEFKREILKQEPGEKMTCLVEALEASGYSKESVVWMKNQKAGKFDLATDKLFQSGYLKKYRVQGYGEFYTISVRGEKAFLLKESLNFIKKSFGNRKKFHVSGERIEDSANSAIVRILCNSAYARIVKINPQYFIIKTKSFFGTDFFCLEFPKAIGERNVHFFAIVSQEVKQFEEALNHLKETWEEAGQYVVIGTSHTQARAVAQWVTKITEQQKPVWYCVHLDETYYDAKTDAEVETTQVLEALDGEAECTETAQTEEGAELRGQETADVDAMVSACETSHLDAAKSQQASEQEVKPSPAAGVGGMSEEERARQDGIYQDMLVNRRFYAAAAYLKVLSKANADYAPVYRQLAYALNDPLEGCSYSSDTIFGIYYSDDPLASDYYVTAAVLRNYFLDQCSYDYSLPQLQALVLGNRVLAEEPLLDRIVYTLQKFKTDYHKGVDRYADYREKERAIWEMHLEENRREAKNYYENICSGKIKEHASHARFMETKKILLGPGSDLCEYLQVVIRDDREMTELLADFLAQHYVKEQSAICAENIDAVKIDLILDQYWDRAAQNMRLVKKSSDLMSSLRMNLFKNVHKIVCVLCQHVALMNTSLTKEDEPGLKEYRKIRTPLLNQIREEAERLTEACEEPLMEQAGKAVLAETLRELQARLEGGYQEGDSKYFYLPFLKSDQVLLDEQLLPVLEDVAELPELSARERIIGHCQDKEREWDARLKEILNGGDDYGSAELILKYMKAHQMTPQEEAFTSFQVEKAIAYPLKDMEHKRSEFIEDLELAQSYGQIDHTEQNSKEAILRIMEQWFLWAKETKNYGFFTKILASFKNKIRRDAQSRAVELENNLQVYLKEHPDWNEDATIDGAVKQIKDRIEQQNYAAAEDLLNRLITNDFDLGTDVSQPDALLDFLNEYDVDYRKTANPGATLKSLVYISKINKDTKGANRLLENWPRGAGVGEHMMRVFLEALGFSIASVKTEPQIQGKIESYCVTLKRPQNGRRSNYKHPISAFGSEAEEKGFRVICIFGRANAQRLIDTFKEIGNAKNTLVLLDYALTLADRRTLARKTKTDLSGKIFAVIDRVVLVYLAKHYTETAINRMLMSVIMPFASYQPYIDKSADVMPQEIFIGRKKELEKIESPTGVNLVYGGRQLGKTALLRMAKKDIDHNENGDRAIIVNAWKKDYRATARTISEALYDEKILKQENITEDWNVLARDIRNRLRDESDPIPYFLLLIDEADVFIESCEAVGFEPFNALKDIQDLGSGRFKFVVAGLRNIVRFKRTAALGDNNVLPHLESLTVKPFKAMEARELLEVPLSYLGFRFPRDNETEVLVSTIFGTTNYFPGLIQLYCAKLIEAMQRDYAGYSESETPPYYVQKEHIKKVLAEQSLQESIKDKFFITLKVGDDDYYYMIALLVAYHYHKNKFQNGCSALDVMELANTFDLAKLTAMETEQITALMEEMRELNVLQHTGDGRYRFARHSFYQMMGTMEQIEDEFLKYMEGE